MHARSRLTRGYDTIPYLFATDPRPRPRQTRTSQFANSQPPPIKRIGLSHPTGGGGSNTDMPLSNHFQLATGESVPTPSVDLRKRNTPTLTRGLQQHDNPTEDNTKGSDARDVWYRMISTCRDDATGCLAGIVQYNTIQYTVPTSTSPSANPSTHGTALGHIYRPLLCDRPQQQQSLSLYWWEASITVEKHKEGSTQ